MSTKPQAGGIENLEPTLVWRFFAGLAATPRPSKKEEKVRAHTRQLAEKAGFDLREDAVGNIVIIVPASPGCENAPITVLQGHLDMVCEKNTGTEYDFDRDPIRTIVETEPDSGELIVRGDGTTLGADNGIGLALGWAAACSPDVVHGPLELLCTVDEEAGMTGAKALEPGFFAGRRLLNLDSEEDDAIYMGCAGGCDMNLAWQFPTGPPDAGSQMIRVAVAGLRGGHSGGDIHENRGNAIKLLAATLDRPGLQNLRIGVISGGSKRNAIPREASAVVAGAAADINAVRKSAEQVQVDGAREHYEPRLSVSIEDVPPGEAHSFLSVQDSGRLLQAVAALPHGVLGMHPKVEGLVQTSNNLAMVTSTPADDGKTARVEVGMLARSSSEWLLDAALDQIAAVGRLTGADVQTGNRYPGWEPNVDSPLLATCKTQYEKLFGESPNVAAIHAGLECGIIGQRVGGMDMVSFGPTIRGAHSPEERVYVRSVEKSWKYLIAVLAELAKG